MRAIPIREASMIFMKEKTASISAAVTLGIILALSGCVEKAEKTKEPVQGQPARPRTATDKPLAAEGFKAAIEVDGSLRNLKPGAVSTLKVKIRNQSTVPWPVAGQSGVPLQINLAYHWLDAGGKPVVWDGPRSFLPHDLNPGEEVELAARVKAPETKGKYTIEFDMVQERVAWFAARGSATTKMEVTVE